MRTAQLVTWSIIFFSILLGLPLTACVFLETHFADPTDFCPWSHSFARGARCRVLDVSDRKILIQHYDTERDVCYLEVRAQNHSRYFLMPPPDDHESRRAFRATLVLGEDAVSHANGTKIQLQPLEERPRW